ncbi:hypothetical protein H696_04593 [Fonticula alba]|uniref:Tyrosine-protein phosphatase domain-containing protein n=1 Tax=Fonticula alba TaxID=691883 RepID=A0A058Z4W8_FONAL|nr:hypothetical protein H696_04593 [Fonticula alba]KCV69181.1 hypothetical protein H696_04593 [Fonticula alba]|eukprot:XP_009496752.1 hypothetical protein H696_04593 [Fonticula alba]
MSLLPPEHFALVEPGIFRCALSSLGASQLAFIQPLSLKTVVVLSPDTLPRALSEFFMENGVEVHSIGLRCLRLGSYSSQTDDTSSSGLGYSSPGSYLSTRLMKEALELALDSSNHPLLVTCSSGIYQSSVFAACLRKLQGWCFSSLLFEYRSFAAGGKPRLLDEHFIERFDTDLVNIPERHKLTDWSQSFLLPSSASEAEGRSPGAGDVAC